MFLKMEKWNIIFVEDSITQNIFFTKENSILEKSFIWKDILQVNKLTFYYLKTKLLKAGDKKRWLFWRRNRKFPFKSFPKMS